MNWNTFFEKDNIIQEKIKIDEFLEQQKNIYEPLEIFPNKNNIYKCFELTQFENLKVVLVGQDPYHQKKQAQGMSFSVPDGIKIPPSLKNIFKELNLDIGCEIPEFGDLTKWGQEGVLLLNASLTVLEGNPNSHYKIWKKFTTELLKYIVENKKNLVFILWGKFSQNLVKNIDMTNQYILSSNHPSPLSVSQKGPNCFIGSRCFSKTNEILEKIGKTPINWNLN
jgi:uracil-DNA glycosylase